LIESKKIGEFQKASNLVYSSEGYFFISDENENSIIKIDTSGSVQKIIGGFGWENSTFDFPSDLFFASLNLFVCDKNNNRIQIFDRFLNFLYQISSEEYLIYPQSCAISAQGDLFVLDSDNKRILKYDMFGKLISEIGYFTNGEFSLENPSKIAINGNSDIFVLEENSLLVFDLFGTGKAKISLKANFTNINSFDNILIMSNEKEVILQDIISRKRQSFEFTDLNSSITDAILINKNLWVLTENSLHQFKILENAKD
jgi:hypothetical protein